MKDHASSLLPKSHEQHHTQSYTCNCPPDSLHSDIVSEKATSHSSLKRGGSLTRDLIFSHKLQQLLLHQMGLILPNIAQNLNGTRPTSPYVDVHLEALVDGVGRFGSVENHAKHQAIFQALGAALALI